MPALPLCEIPQVINVSREFFPNQLDGLTLRESEMAWFSCCFGSLTAAWDLAIVPEQKRNFSF